MIRLLRRFRRFLQRFNYQLGFRGQLLWGSALTLIAVFLTALFLSYLSALADRPAVLEIATDWQADSRSGFAWQGAGISWSTDHPANLLKNGGFEGYTAKIIAPVLAANGSDVDVPMRVEAGELPYFQSFVEAQVRAPGIPSPKDGSEETHVQKLTNYVLRHPHQLPSTIHLDSDIRLVSTAARHNAQGNLLDAVTVGTRGTVIFDPQGNQPRLLTGIGVEDWMEVAALSSGYLLRARSGRVWSSADGQHWQMLQTSGLVGSEDPCIRIVAADESFLLHFASGRFLYLDSSWNLTRGPFLPAVQAGITVAIGSEFRVITEAGTLYELRVNQGEALGDPLLTAAQEPVLQSVVQAACLGKQTYYLQPSGAVFRYTGGEQKFYPLTSSEIPKTSQWKKSVFESARFWLAGEDHLVLATEEGCWIFEPDHDYWREWVSTQNEPFTHAVLLPRSLLLTQSASGLISTYQLATTLTLQDEAFASRLHSGDRLVIQQDLPAPNPPPFWKIEQNPAKLGKDRVNPSVPSLALERGEGHTWLRVPTGTVLTQTLTIGEENWPERGIFELALRARPAHGDKSPDRVDSAILPKLQLSVETDNQIFETDFELDSDAPDASWQTLQTQFVSLGLPEDQNKRELVLRLSTVEGAVDLDSVFLGRSGTQEEDIDAGFAEWIRETRPAILRLAGVRLGAAGRPLGSWLQPTPESYLEQGNQWLQSNGHPLGSGLRLAESVGALPWIVLEPQTNPEELNALLDYLAGDAQTPSGSLRIVEGQTLPWTRLFGRIYLEFIGQPDGRLSDREQADIADQLLQQIQRSPWYPELKNKLIFVDGIQYQHQEKLTLADVHASAIPPDFAQGLPPERTYQALQTHFPRQDWQPTQGSTREILRSIPFRDPSGGVHSLAHLLQLAYVGEGRLTAGALYDIDGIWPAGDRETQLLQTLLTCLPPNPGGSHLMLLNRRLEPGQEENQQALEQIGSFGVVRPDGKAVLLVSNTGREAQTVRIENGEPREISEDVFDRWGKPERKRSLYAKSIEVEIPAGGAILLQSEVLRDSK